MNRCAVWAANAAVVWSTQDDQRAEEVACMLRELRARAALLVPGWEPWMRTELARKQRQWVKYERYQTISEGN